MSFTIPSSEEESYTTLHLHPKQPLLFLGTTKGCIEMWDLRRQEKIVELRYLVIDDFGEQIPIDEPVVSITSNNDCSLVYGFFGNAAYCIDVELKVIVQQIPISERVISGSVSVIDDTIGVITKPGYLSLWSPKFYERIASHEFLFSLESGYITYGFDGSLIIVMPHRIIVYGKEADRYFIGEVDPKILDLDLLKYMEIIKYDQNENYNVFVGEANVIINPEKKIIDDQHPFFQGKLHADLLLCEKILQSNFVRDYIDDFRLERRGKDRYLAEAEALISHTPIQSRSQSTENYMEDDSKTLAYAFEDYNDEDIHKKSIAQEVISTIARRHNVRVKYLNIAYEYFGMKKYNTQNIIEFARTFEFKTAYRSIRIRNIIIISLISSFLILLISHVNPSRTGLIFHIIFLLTQFVVLLYWRQINSRPYYFWIEDYHIVRKVNIIILVYILLRFISIYTTWGVFLPFN